jgi:lysophospholipase L1-like esterase
MDSVRIKLEKLILIGVIPAFLAFYLPATSGVFFFIALSLILISSLVFLKRLGAFFAYFQRRKSFLNNLLLTVTCTMLSLILFESFLWILQSRPKNQQKLVMPQEWRKRAVSIPGTSHAYYWHNILHVHDRNHMRRTSPFPPKSKKQFRIMVVGDSLTYGYGVREEETYPMQIETVLKKTFNVEVLNLGVSGYQSEDILKIITKYIPLLQPNLIIYGVCLNDFLPSGVGQYENNMTYRFPLPEGVKAFLVEKTHLGRLVSDAYNYVLIKLGLRNDFYADILKNFKNYQTRFARDVKDMNMFVLNRGLPPIVAMVLNQFPDLNSNGYQIAMVAEEHLKNAGMAIISTKDFYQRYDKQKMVVSPWEGHPNAKANEIFADFFIAHLQHRSDLERYKLHNERAKR